MILGEFLAMIRYFTPERSCLELSLVTETRHYLASFHGFVPLGILRSKDGKIFPVDANQSRLDFWPKCAARVHTGPRRNVAGAGYLFLGQPSHEYCQASERLW